MKKPFWLVKPLSKMTDKEWESLCDGCGKCCVNVLEDAEDGGLYQTNVACYMLDRHSCRCKDYDNRKKHVPGCVNLTPNQLPAMDWLPNSCAYVLVMRGEDLPDWHHLKCGNIDEIHNAGRSVRGRVVSELDVNDLEDHIIAWFDEP